MSLPESFKIFQSVFRGGSYPSERYHKSHTKPKAFIATWSLLVLKDPQTKEEFVPWWVIVTLMVVRRYFIIIIIMVAVIKYPDKCNLGKKEFA